MTKKQLFLINIEFVENMLKKDVDITKQVSMLKERDVILNNKKYIELILLFLKDEYINFSVRKILINTKVAIKTLLTKENTIDGVYQKLINVNMLFLFGFRRNITLEEFKIYLYSQNLLKEEKNRSSITIDGQKTDITGDTKQTIPINNNETKPEKIKDEVENKYDEYEEYLGDDDVLNTFFTLPRDTYYSNMSLYNESMYFERYLFFENLPSTVGEKRWFCFNGSMQKREAYELLVKEGIFKNYDLIGIKTKGIDLKIYRYYNNELHQLKNSTIDVTNRAYKQSINRGEMNVISILDKYLPDFNR